MHELSCVPKRGGSLCDEDLENLRLWTLQVVSNVKSDLTPQGYEDLNRLGVRYRSRFPELFKQTVTKDSFKVSKLTAIREHKVLRITR
jgi:hypothetical protein